MNKLILILLSLILSASCQSRWEFYGNKIMPDESVLFSADVNPRTANLLFKPNKVISVKAADESITYEEGKDYTVDLEKGQIHLTKDSRIPCPKLYGGDKKPYGPFKNKQGQKMLFSEGSYFHKLQLKVAYEHSGKEWDNKDFIPAPKSEKFQSLHQKLKTNDTVKVALIGDSISFGYNASGFVKAAPHQDPFGPMVAKRLDKAFAAKIEFSNNSRPGATVGWALKNVQKTLPLKPELVMIAFGMNDGRRPGRDQLYEDQLRKLIDILRKNDSKVEIVLVANMLPNEEFSDHKGHFANRDRLYKLEKDYQNVAVADVMSVTEAMLKRKKFADICGNHVNHPNDFIHRLYAEVILRTIGAK